MKTARILFFSSLFFCVVFMGITTVGGIAEMRVSPQVDMILAMIMELLTVCLIPLTLRAHKSEAFMGCLKRNSQNPQQALAVLRISVIEMLVLLNLICYMLTLNATFQYLALISFIIFAFIYPRKPENTEA